MEINGCKNIEEAISSYFLEQEIEYNCSSCKKQVTATKQMWLEQPPVVLCIYLTRFSGSGPKDNTPIASTPQLNLCQYSSQSTPTYRLVSIVEHLGSTIHSGHYTATCLTNNGAFHQFDDHKVKPISIDAVSNGYVAFYEVSVRDQRKDTKPL